MPVSAFLQCDGGVFEGKPPGDGDNRYRQFRLGFFPSSEVNEQGFEYRIRCDSYARQHLGCLCAVVGGVVRKFPKLMIDAGIRAHL